MPDPLPPATGAAGEHPSAGAARGLTERQRRFVDEYLVDGNGTQAAIRAGFSPRAASVQAARLLANAKVAESVRLAQAERAERTKLTQDAVIAGLRAEAERMGEGGTASARVAAWKLLGQHLGMFQDRPLDILLAMLPRELAEPIREALQRYAAEGGQLPHGGKAGG